MIQLENVIESLKYIQYFNSLDLEETEISFNGKPINIPEKLIKRWKYIGIPNVEILNGLDNLENVESNYLGKL